MSAESTPTLTLPNDNGDFTFKTWEEFTTWIDEEIAFWSKMASRQHQTWAKYSGPLSSIRDRSAVAGSFDGQPWQETADRLQGMYSRGAIHHLSAKGRFVSDLLTRFSPITAGAAWAYFTRTDVEHGHSWESQQGVFYAASYEAGTPLGASAATRSFEALVKEITEWFSGKRSEIGSEHTASIEARGSAAAHAQKLTAELDVLTKNTTNEVEAIRADSGRSAAELLTNAGRDLTKFITESKAELKTLTDTYNDKLALQSSVTYWTTKRDSHRTWSKVFGIAFAAMLVVGGWALFILVKDLIPADATWDKAPVVRLLEWIIVVTFSLWLVKTIMRLFLIHLHLAEDASERVVMTNTYLALLRESAGIKDNDRELVLQSLFRRASTGIVKDDANPPFLLSMMQRRDSHP